MPLELFNLRPGTAPMQLRRQKILNRVHELIAFLVQHTDGLLCTMYSTIYCVLKMHPPKFRKKKKETKDPRDFFLDLQPTEA